MANTFQTGYKSTVALPVSASDTTITVAVAPIVTKGRMKLGSGTVQERISYTGVSGLVLTGVTRGLSQTANPATAGTGLSWLAGSPIKLVAMHDQLLDTKEGANIDGANTFSGEVIMDGEFYPPRYTTTQRDAITWNRDGAIIYNTTTNVLQQRLGGAWNDVGNTGTPDLSESVSGKGRYTSNVQYSAGTDADGSGNPLLPKPSQVKASIDTLNTSIAGASSPSAIYDSSNICGEGVMQGQSLFLESGPTFAQATSVANIGDVNANKRYAFPIIGTGIAMTTLKLGLKKFLAPGVDLKLRPETDNAGSPSGTLFSGATETTILTSGLTTSIVDTIVTLAQSITIPLGTVVWMVMYAGTYGSETINASNYFGIAYYTNDTTTRGRKLWNGSVYSAVNTAIWTYVTGTGITDRLLSLTNATYTYKLPTDMIRVANETRTIGQSVVCTINGLNSKQSGLTVNSEYFLSNTPGAISTTAGTNKFIAGYSKSTTSIYVGSNNYIYNPVYSTLNSAIGIAGTNTSSTYTAARKEYVSFVITATSLGVVSGATVNLQYSPDGTTWTTIYTLANVNNSISSTYYLGEFLKIGYYRTQSIVTNSGSASFTVLKSTLLGI